MFLNKLTIIEKETFISLAVMAAEANNIITDEEYTMLEEYCKELGIAFFDARNIKSMDEIIDVYKNSDIKNKKIVLFEVIGLMYADGNFDEQELNFVMNLASKIGLTGEDVNLHKDLMQKYINISREIYDAITNYKIK